MRRALVVVDVQNDFADPAGSLFVRGAEQVVLGVAARVAFARETGGLVVWTQDWHPARTPHFDTDGGIWPVHCVAESWGAAFHPSVSDLVRDDPVVRKGADGSDGYSGFSVRDPVSGSVTATELGSLLAGISDLEVVGLAGDYCVQATAVDGVRLGHAVVVPLGLTAFVNVTPGDDERSVAAMRAAGVVVEG